MKRWLSENSSSILLITILFVAIIAVPASCVLETREQVITLNKEDWICSRYGMIKTIKRVGIKPKIFNDTGCIQYSR